jgi:hypothetical protein
LPNQRSHGTSHPHEPAKSGALHASIREIRCQSDHSPPLDWGHNVLFSDTSCLTKQKSRSVILTLPLRYYLQSDAILPFLRIPQSSVVHNIKRFVKQ